MRICIAILKRISLCWFPDIHPAPYLRVFSSCQTSKVLRSKPTWMLALMLILLWILEDSTYFYFSWKASPLNNFLGGYITKNLQSSQTQFLEVDWLQLFWSEHAFYEFIPIHLGNILVNYCWKQHHYWQNQGVNPINTLDHKKIVKFYYSYSKNGYHKPNESFANFVKRNWNFIKKQKS